MKHLELLKFRTFFNLRSHGRLGLEAPAAGDEPKPKPKPEPEPDVEVEIPFSVPCLLGFR